MNVCVFPEAGRPWERSETFQAGGGIYPSAILRQEFKAVLGELYVAGEPQEATMDGLPLELLELIFLKLPTADRLSCARACRQWAQVLCSSALLMDVRFVVRGPCSKARTTILMGSNREYSNFRIVRANLNTFNRSLWTKIGGNIRDLHLIRCEWSIRSLASILRQCPKLESLTLTAGAPLCTLPVLHKPPKRIRLDKVRTSVLSVRTLIIEDSEELFLSEDTLDHLLELMPNLTSLSMRSSFEGDADFKNAFPSLMKSRHRFTELDIDFDDIDSEHVIRLMEKYSESLRKLSLRSCCYLTVEAYAAISRCSNLRSLLLNEAKWLDDRQARILLDSSPELESLSIRVGALRNETTSAILGLKKLRRLILKFTFIVDPGFLSCLKSLSSLEHLELDFIEDGPELFRTMACLKNLRTLILADCEITSDCVEVIVENFKKIETLELNCITLNELDGTKFRLLKNLRSLSLDQALWLTDSAFESGIGPSDLESLALSSCPLTDVGLLSIATNHGRLEKLELSACRNISDAGVASLLSREPFLRSLSLASCWGLSDKILRFIRDRCFRLDLLELQLYQMTRSAVALFVKRRPSVEIQEYW
ncbi:F-box/LRR-repeat protein 7 [Galendromus occidentalis]|uniref:F-box/LRR-repeat protein 7 n=1 Tax=Galendromus occidentalis TaxID=34638 RepID=A0AAJ6VXT9_9ACAR|nr:F-box/LRR-repeat protein 7 [Galendromus occidentalis]